MAGQGPAPKHPSTRSRRTTVQMTMLPAAGRRSTRVPKWPLKPDIALSVRHRTTVETVARVEAELGVTKDGRSIARLRRELAQAHQTAAVLEAQIDAQATAEAELWGEVWKLPQAAMWEQLAWGREVASYVRWQAKGELGDLEAAKEARQWSDRLGLNPLSLLRLRWEIERTEDAEERGRARQRRQGVAQPKPVDDPRRLLMAVGDDGLKPRPTRSKRRGGDES